MCCAECEIATRMSDEGAAAGFAAGEDAIVAAI
jgi:hypothetical protein